MLAVAPSINVDSEPGRFVLPIRRLLKHPQSHALRYLIVFFLIFFDQQDSMFGTTVVVLRGPEYVVLGSDSKITSVTGNQTASSLGCKIRQIHKIFVGVAGAAGQAGSFDVFEVARKAATGKTDVIAIANQFEIAARKPFAAYIRRFRQENPAQFARYCDKRDCLVVAFAGIDRATPKVSVRAFFVTTRNNVVIVRADTHSRMDCPGTCETGIEQAVFGVNSEASSLFDRTPHFWKVKGIVSGMEELVGAEISAHGDVVGPPISILMLNGQGAHFLPSHQGLCADPYNDP